MLLVIKKSEFRVQRKTAAASLDCEKLKLTFETMKEVYASGLSSGTTLFDYVFVANYAAEIFLLISGLNYIEERSVRGMTNKSPS